MQADYYTGMFNEMSINHVNVPNNECFMNHNITDCLKNTFPLLKLKKYHLKREDLPFSAPFRPHEFRFPRTNIE